MAEKDTSNIELAYISGAITNGPGNYGKESFEAMAGILEKLKIRYINPRARQLPAGITKKSINRAMFKRSVIDLFDCDAIIMLDNWETSTGATIEKTIAEYLSIPVYYEYEFCHLA